DINVALRNILYRQATEGSRIINYRQPLSLDYCILEGVGSVEKALTVVEDRLEFDQFAVHIAGYDEDAPDEPEFEEGSCRIVWNSNGDHSHRSIVYIAYGLLR